MAGNCAAAGVAKEFWGRAERYVVLPRQFFDQILAGVVAGLGVFGAWISQAHDQLYWRLFHKAIVKASVATVRRLGAGRRFFGIAAFSLVDAHDRQVVVSTVAQGYGLYAFR